MTYEQFVLSKNPDLTHERALIMAAMGLAGETGELVDMLKKEVFYDKKADINKIVEEAGDILYYLTHLLITVDKTLEDVIEFNKTKLDKRYPNGFSKEDALARKDKQ